MGNHFKSAWKEFRLNLNLLNLYHLKNPKNTGLSDKMDVIVKKSEIEGEITPPPSKSYTHRAFIAASLSPLAEVSNPLISEDTIATLNFCRFIGAGVLRDRSGFTFEGVGSIESEGYINLANSGTTLRLAIGILSLSKSGRYSVLDGDSSLRTRPNYQLVEVLRVLGADIYGNKDFRAPVWVKGVAKGGKVEIKAKSSQFISSLLYSLPLAKNNSVLKVLATKSKPYIDITLHILRESGIEIESIDNNFYISGGQDFRLRKFTIPSDFSSTSYLIAAGLIAGDITIKNVFDSVQGDKVIIDVVNKMGGKVRWYKDDGELKVKKSSLEGIEFDASDTPDIVPTIAALAAVAEGKTRIFNAEHLRIKEIDRIEGIYRNLKSLGIEAKATEDGLEITGGAIKRGEVQSFGDHRMALAFSLLGLAGEVIVNDAEVVSVSFPGYFEFLKSMGADIDFVTEG